jgi:ribosomal protein L35
MARALQPWRACRAVACGAATLSCRATRAGAAKRVRSANNIFEMLFLKINFKRLKLKKKSVQHQRNVADSAMLCQNMYPLELP